MDPAVTTIVTGCIILLICVELNVVEIYYDNYMPYVIQYGGFFDNIHEMIEGTDPFIHCGLAHQGKRATHGEPQN